MAATAEDERTVDERAVVTASVPATELVRALGNAVLALSKHPDPPILGAVHITWRAGVLLVTSTDRRLLIGESLDVISADGPGQLLLPDRDTRNLFKVIGKNPGPVLATLRLAGDRPPSPPTPRPWPSICPGTRRLSRYRRLVCGVGGRSTLVQPGGADP